MSTQHADPAEAIQIAIDTGAQHLLGIHWGTFQLTDEPWDEPPALLKSAMQRAQDGLHAHAFHSGNLWQPE
jgi:L-ascorbate metabolism protein UlaG (beta-lactamase superfamily)